MKVLIRKFKPDTDSGIIYSSFPKGVYYAASRPPYQSEKQKDDPAFKQHWFKAFYEYMKDMLAKGSVTIACLADDEDTIIGYSIVDGDSLEFVYVKESFRNQGIAKLLTNNRKFSKYNNLTKVGLSILNKQEQSEAIRTND